MPVRKIYRPPEPEAIEDAAERLSHSLNRDADFEEGFGNLLKVIARAYAKNLSRDTNGELLDNADDCL